jgi:aryl-alcohol dehydrogenase-like predicted oxidoreductase
MEKLLPAAQAKGVGIIVRVPFEEGLLTGRLTPEYQFPKGDWRESWATPQRRAEALARVEKLKSFLAADRPTYAALALKFCLSHPAVSTVIPGMRSTAHVDQNVAVSDGKLLSASEFEQLRAHAFAHGWSYPWAQK